MQARRNKTNRNFESNRQLTRQLGILGACVFRDFAYGPSRILYPVCFAMSALEEHISTQALLRGLGVSHGLRHDRMMAVLYWRPDDDRTQISAVFLLTVFVARQ